MATTDEAIDETTEETVEEVTEAGGHAVAPILIEGAGPRWLRPEATRPTPGAGILCRGLSGDLSRGLLKTGATDGDDAPDEDDAPDGEDRAAAAPRVPRVLRFRRFSASPGGRSGVRSVASRALTRR